MHIEDIAYDIDGTEHIGQLAVDRDRAGTRPAVLVCHEGSGLGPHAKNIAQRLAGLGYIAFALDYFGGGVPVARDQTMARLGPLMGDPTRTRTIAAAGLAILLAQPEADHGRVAAIGYCFGGTMALELARGGADVHAVVGFHSGLATARPQDAVNIRGAVLVNIGTEDPIIPAQQRADFEAEMRAGDVDWQMNLYGGAKHSFTNPDAAAAGIPGIEYHEPSDRRSWRCMIDLFDETFGPMAT